MDQAVLGAEEVDEGAKISGFHDLAGIDDAQFRLSDDAADFVDRGLRFFVVGGRDFDSAVIVDVDFGAGLLDDLADDLAAGADDVADFVLRHLDHGDPRGRR